MTVTESESFSYHRLPPPSGIPPEVVRVPSERLRGARGRLMKINHHARLVIADVALLRLRPFHSAAGDKRMFFSKRAAFFQLTAQVIGESLAFCVGGRNNEG